MLLLFSHFRVPLALAFPLLTLPFVSHAQNVGIGTAQPNASAALDVSSTTKGFLPPRMTQAQRDVINPATSAAGLLIFNLDSKQLNLWDGVRWAEVNNAYQPVSNFQSQSGPYTRTFTPSTTIKKYTVPPTVNYIQVQATGGSGNAPTGGYGAQVTAILKVIPGEVLTIVIGGQALGNHVSSGATALQRDPLVGSTGDIISTRNALLVAGGGGSSGDRGGSGIGGNGGGAMFGGPPGNYGNSNGSGKNGDPNGTGGTGGSAGPGGYGGGQGGNGLYGGNGGGGGGIGSRGNGGVMPSSPDKGNTPSFYSSINDYSGGAGGGGYLGGGAGVYVEYSSSPSGGGGGGSSWVTPLPALQAPSAPAPVFGVSQNHGDGQLVITPVQ